MDILSGAVELFSSAGLSSIVGFFGGLVAKRQEIKLKREEYRHEQIMGEQELKVLELEQNHELEIADKQIQRAEVEGEIEVEAREVGAFESSIKTSSKTKGALRWVRPGITVYLLLASSLLTYYVWTTVGGLDSFTPGELNELLREVVRAAIFLTVLAVSWWFGSRGGNLTKAHK